MIAATNGVFLLRGFPSGFRHDRFSRYHGECVGISEKEAPHYEKWDCQKCRNVPFPSSKVAKKRKAKYILREIYLTSTNQTCLRVTDAPKTAAVPEKRRRKIKFALKCALFSPFHLAIFLDRIPTLRE